MDRSFFENDITKYDSYREYLNDLERFSYRECKVMTPEVVIRICDELAKQIESEHILVSSFNSGMLSFGLSELGYKVSSLIQNDAEYQIADKFSFEQYSKDDGIQFNFICSDVLFDLKQKDYIYGMADVVSVAIKEDGFFTMTFPAYSKKKYKDILEYLENKGLFANGVIDMPKGAYVPITNIDTKILIFQRKCSEKRFIAKISELKDVNVVISNFINNVTAQNYSIGSWIDRDKYFDIQDFEAEITYRNEEKIYDGNVFLIESLAKEVNRPDRDNNFKDIPNAIYIPRIGISQVVDSIDDFTLKPQNYIQVVLDEEKISTQYACFFLNSKHGIANRKMVMMKSCVISSLNIYDVNKLVIVLPDGDGVQNEILETHNKIEELRLQVDAIESKFFKKPLDYKTIQKSLKDINNTETLSDWVETLPFPLASILRRYLSANSYEKKQETLFLFFEAYAVFNACILLSVINDNLNIFECSTLFKKTDIEYFKRSSFGSWVTLNKIITDYVIGKIESKKSEEGEESPLVGYFKTDSFEIIKVLCNRDINKILDNAREKRNDWKGHTGISSEQICKNHVIVLEQFLNQLRSVVRDTFEEMELIRAVSCVNTRSGANNTIEKLVGSNTLFMKEKFETTTPLISDVLYLKMKDTRSVIELLPLIVFKNEKNACYFYSKNENDNTLYVSYHYEQQPEESEPGHEAFDALSRIIPGKVKK